MVVVVVLHKENERMSAVAYERESSVKLHRNTVCLTI